ncbi:histidine phosphatase family protein [Salinibacterium sp. SYSU T00001]|uniref:histidine phosphatase family protein n=1 Tax=Homoserinimonas sedimenticola TaxID=2986805 RepID=UPI00223560CE|nr:histidine phosphatase family protein [Salinibacterium sedimenticola]MCW4384873.1 histidine phosphatase family protein [Salinibacterium sedimenticola]
MTIAFIRHGQTDWNAEGRMQGGSDIPLNDVGREQAREAASVLVDGGWDVIVSSPLSRARETAAIIADGIELELGRSYEQLIERNYGEGEGLTRDEIESRWGSVQKTPGMETLDSVVGRGTAALQQISEEYAGRNVVVVCHGTIIRYTLAKLAGRPLDQIMNGSISTLDYRDEAWRVLSVNGVELVVEA